MNFLKVIFGGGKEKKADAQSGSIYNPPAGHLGHRFNDIVYETYDGEKTAGELGNIVSSVPDHLGLRLRAYDLNLKTDLIRVITGKFFKWVIGSGLKLQAEPKETVLDMFGLSENFDDFKKNIEALYSLYADSNYSDYHRLNCLHDKAAEVHNTAFLGGDCLFVIRVDQFGPNVQVIDGQQVESPIDDTGKGEGNVIKHGIEMNSRGEHVAFWVCVDMEDSEISHKRIKARNSNGNVVAKMVYGDKARVDHHRGIPRIAAILEKVSKLDRYVEASVKKAEETANVVYAFQHDETSTGENIMLHSLGSKQKNDDDAETNYEKTGRTANTLRQTTSSTVMNLTPGSKLVSLSSPSEGNFNEFFRAVFVVLCASVDIPEEVALQKYEQNYSSSRAAINGWEFLIEVYRKKFANDFYKPFYRVWLEYNILTGNVPSDGFIQAKTSNNFMALEAYYCARFLGKKMPHIDPLKEAKAIREMLGGDETPLISREQATEAMGAGDWHENYKKYEQENELTPDSYVENQNNSGQAVESDT